MAPDFTKPCRLGSACTARAPQAHKNAAGQGAARESSMRRFAAVALWLGSLVALWGCSSNTVLVSVPPRMQLQGYGTLGLVEFDSNSNPTINAQTTREFESHVHAAQPGTRIVELGSREQLLASVGGRQLDALTLRKIGEKYGVDAIFIGSVTYSEPKTDVKITDANRL